MLESRLKAANVPVSDAGLTVEAQSDFANPNFAPIGAIGLQVFRSDGQDHFPDFNSDGQAMLSNQEGQFLQRTIGVKLINNGL